MGNQESQQEDNESNEASAYGYQVLKIQSKSPCDGKGLAVFFDFIIGINGISLSTGDVEEFLSILRGNTDQDVRLTILNVRSRRIRDVQVVPSLSWGGNQHLGINIRLSSTSIATEIVWHVMDVEAKSPAAEAGLEMHNDYIVGSPNIIFSDSEDLFSLIQANIGKPLNFFVFNKARDDVRIVTLTPNDSWGGNGCLGCDVGYGVLHRLPGVSQDPYTYEEGVPELEILTQRDLDLSSTITPAESESDVSSPPIGEPPANPHESSTILSPPSPPPTLSSESPVPAVAPPLTVSAPPEEQQHSSPAPPTQSPSSTTPSLPSDSLSLSSPPANVLSSDAPPSDEELLRPVAIRLSAPPSANDLPVESGDQLKREASPQWDSTNTRLTASVPEPSHLSPSDSALPIPHTVIDSDLSMSPDILRHPGTPTTPPPTPITPSLASPISAPSVTPISSSMGAPSPSRQTVDLDALQRKRKELEARLAKVQQGGGSSSASSLGGGIDKQKLEARLAALRAKP